MRTRTPLSRGVPAPLDGDALTNGARWLAVAGVATGGDGVSSETERVQAIRARWQAATPGPWFVAPDGVADGVFAADGALLASCETSPDAQAIAAAPTDIATLLAALDAAEARSTALQAALAQATHGYLHRVGEGTGYAVWHCRLCGDTTFDTHAPNHQSWCPVLVLGDSYREE